ncbi:MAG: alpha-ketoacid dehydrogenase subunit beta [Bacillus sp. (in: firmicutes)]
MAIRIEEVSAHSSSAETEMTLVQAVNDGLRIMLQEDEKTIILGEDVGKNGGVFRATDGLQADFGEDRVVDTPLSEAGIIGTSVGLASNGFHPIAEIQFLGFIYPAYEQIMTHVSRLRMRTMGHYTVPMVIRAPYGGGIHAPEIHSDSTEALFTHMPGIKVVCPSNPYDAKGLLISAIEDPDPVLFLESMKNYRLGKQSVPSGKYTVEIGKGEIVRAGTDVTLLTWGAMVSVADKAAAEAEKLGISCEVIDLRTLSPLDRDIIAQSVQKTGRAVIIHEAQRFSGFGAELLSTINDTSFLYLKAPIARVTGFDIPVPLYSLEHHHLPNCDRVLQAIKETYHF